MLELEALDALDQTEERAVREHLEDCAECRAELRELRDAAAMLVHLVPAATPPAHLRARILDAVAAEERKSNAKAETDTRPLKEKEPLPFVPRRAS
jgi:anti-sigma factor RsiW